MQAKTIVVTSDEPDIGRTTTSAAIGSILALRGYKTVIVDFEVGRRHLDKTLGLKPAYDFVDVINGDASVQQALIKYKRLENLFVLASSKSHDTDALTQQGVEKVLTELKGTFDYILCHSPVVTAIGARWPMYFADAVIGATATAGVSAIRNLDRMLGNLTSKSRRAENGEEPVEEHLLITSYHSESVRAEPASLSRGDVDDILTAKLIGVIPASSAVLKARNEGLPVVLSDEQSDASQAYSDSVDRLLGQMKPLRFVDPQDLARLSGSA
ncbi:AAA family ATPase [Streptomyces xanthophaeus]